MTNHLLGAHEVAALFHISRQRLHQIVAEDKSFPAPVATLAAGNVWDREQVEQWGREKGRLT